MMPFFTLKRKTLFEMVFPFEYHLDGMRLTNKRMIQVYEEIRNKGGKVWRREKPERNIQIMKMRFLKNMEIKEIGKEVGTTHGFVAHVINRQIKICRQYKRIFIQAAKQEKLWKSLH